MQNNSWIKLNNQVAIRNENGDFNFAKDKEAAKAYFLEYVNKNTVFFYTLKEKIDYLIDNEYYIDFFNYYTFAEIKSVFQHVYSKKFRFSSFMAASKFYSSYALKDDKEGKFLERYEDRIATVALFLAKNEENKSERALELANMMINQEYQPATPTFLNAGKKRAGELVSCFLDEISDSLAGIGYAVDSAMKLSSIGGGVSFNISKIRARGEAIKGVDGRAGGVLPVMKIFEDTFSYANQLGQRPGAGAVYLSVFHQDINEFLDCKKINVDEKSRIKSLSIGVIINDKFMELAEKDENYYAFGPHSVYVEYGKYLDELDMDAMYSELVTNPNVKKTKINTRELLAKIAITQKESGYPYVFFKENANRPHALKNLGEVKFSNLCTEIMQVSEVSEVKHRDEITAYRYGISCNLGSLNLVPLIENGNFAKTIRGAFRALSTVTEESNIKEVPSIQKANAELRSVGLGAMNLHGLLAKNHIMYDSLEARKITNVIFMLINYYTLVESCQLAKEKGKTFVGFEGSEYATGEYFDDYLSQGGNYYDQYIDVKGIGVKGQAILDSLPQITIDDWANLYLDIRKYGLYNAYRLAIAPNQSTSYIMSATASTMPIVDQIEVREYGDSTTYYPMPYMDNDNFFFFKSAYDMDQIEVMKMMAVIQKHIDQGVSCILHTNSTDSTRDLARYYIAAHKLGLKSLYYTRTRKSSIEDCVSCSA